MSQSQVIEKALDEYGVPGDVLRSSEHPCEGAKFHSPRPLTTQRYTFGSVKTILCPTCCANLQVLLHFADSQTPTGKALEWTLLREFGNQLRALGKQILATWPHYDG